MKGIRNTLIGFGILIVVVVISMYAYKSYYNTQNSLENTHGIAGMLIVFGVLFVVIKWGSVLWKKISGIKFSGFKFSPHPKMKLALGTIGGWMIYVVFWVALSAFIFFVAPKIYAFAHPPEPGKEVVRTTTDATGQRWEEHCLPVTKEWQLYAFDDGPASQLWPTKDSLLVRYANGTQQVTLYPKFMGKVTDVHFYSNHFELKLPDASPHESDEVTFKLAVN